MNNIRALQVEVEAGKGFRLEFGAALNRFRAYLCSDKFHIDSTIQVQDVLNRLSDIERDAYSEYESIREQAARDERERKLNPRFAVVQWSHDSERYIAREDEPGSGVELGRSHSRSNLVRSLRARGYEVSIIGK